MIPVTKPFLPPFEKYQALLTEVWSRQWLTNMGPCANELEARLQQYLKTKNALFVTNGTVALQMAIKALCLSGEIITTPFSFVATTSCIVWENCKPVFVDIDPHSLNIDPKHIEAAITPHTSAILATHVYGNPCDVEAIERIAKKHGLKVIYDAAHAFAVTVNGLSVFMHGDISTCSLHATKLYHSIEGGLMFAKDEHMIQELKYMRNFGISGFDTFANLGINGKNSEMHAAMGLVNLEFVGKILDRRKTLSEAYDEQLRELDISTPVWHPEASRNYAYYPVLFESEPTLLQVKEALEKEDIQSRRYFYPSLASSLPYLEAQHLPVADDVAKRVLCLPLYYDLTLQEIDRICRICKHTLSQKSTTPL